MDTSSSSKVTVEYHDPSGIFPLLSSDLTARSPLRNLSWTSSSRPPRQIKSIHLDFVPDESTHTSLRPASSPLESHGVPSLDNIGGRGDVHKVANVKERRHQIPGLQTSPYLKIYILRCDDKDTYKATERENLRAWICDIAANSAHSSSKTKARSANHDAFEWLILHVVVPGTLASGEPRWRESTREPDELKERKQGVKWPGHSTQTVFDKLRADFNESSKSAQDRVAQIRLSKDQVPPDLLPTSTIALTYQETLDESSKSWNDLISKLKTLILDPFDRRVKQYETDIAEQESRRSLPGFNFCTFFIHKEGLAKALESIGLTEDALVIYDELAVGLEIVLHDIVNGLGNTTTAFAPSTHDIEHRITASYRSNALNGNATAQPKDNRKEPHEHDYRDEIVRNAISVFDFFNYLFSRQGTLILRIANARSAQAQHESQTKEPAEDLVMISELCWRGTIFAHNNARVLQRELSTQRRNSEDATGISNNDVDALVASWVYAFVTVLLHDTTSPALDRFADHSRREGFVDDVVTSPRRTEFQSLGGANVYPLRTTSLPPRQSRVHETRRDRKASHSQSEEDLPNPLSRSSMGVAAGLTASPDTLPGLPELATYRADLIMMQRKMLELCARQRGWLAGWASLRDGQESTMIEIDLTSGESSTVCGRRERASGRLGPAIAKALESRTTFYATYTHLSESAMRLYISATQTKSAETIMGDLAIAKSQQGDHGYAANYFQYVLPLYKEQCWSLLEARAAKMLAQCYKALNRTSEYVDVLLSLVASAVAAQTKSRGPAMEDIDELSAFELLKAAGEASTKLDNPIIFPAQKIFEVIELDPTVMHQDDSDGFFLRLKLRQNLHQLIMIDHASACLVGLNDAQHELWLKSSASLRLEHGLNEVQLESDASTVGPYFVKKIVLKMKNLCFVRLFTPEEGTTQQLRAVESDTQSEHSALFAAHLRQWIYLFPPEHGFDAEIRLAKNIYIDKARHIEIHLRSGWNEIESAKVRLKPGSAGLRLHLADAEFCGNEKRRAKASIEPGSLHLGGMNKGELAVVTVPYSLEHASGAIAIHLSVHYTVSSGKTYNYMASVRLSTGLPLDVDVNDVFHLDALYSTFSVRTTEPSPLKIVAATLASSALYEVETPPINDGTLIYERVPAKFIYRIIRRGQNEGSIAKKDTSLALSVRYRAADELIIKIICTIFDGDLAQTGLSKFRRVLNHYLRMRQLVLSDRHEVHTASVSDRAIVPSYDEVGWDELVATLPSNLRDGTSAWLRSWHEGHKSVALSDERAGLAVERSITISVDIPTVDFVHKTSLILVQQHGDVPQVIPQVLELGKPVKARVHLTSTQAWSARPGFGSHSRDQRPNRGFVMEVNADSTHWLVGGQRRVQTRAPQAEEELSWEVILVPMKQGLNTLPTVEVHPLTARDASTEQEQAITCETECSSAGQAVRVVRDQRRVRVSIPECVLHAPPLIATEEAHASRRPSTAITIATNEPP